MKKKSYLYTWTAISISACLWAVSFNTGTAASAVGNAPAAVNSQSPAPSSTLQQTQVSLKDRVDQWIVSISKQEGWEEWKVAEQQIHTLGPGTHGWIVQLSKDDEPVGYLIVNATEDGDYTLGEYGRGDSPLFSKKTLNNALSRLGLTPSEPSDKGAAASPFYYDALQAFWQVEWNGETYYLDAQTGEELPFGQLPEGFKPAPPGDSPAKLSGPAETSIGKPFDPYEAMSWVQGEPLIIKSGADLKQALGSYNRITYVGDLYEELYHVPLAVIGYTKWEDGGTFLAVSVDSAGERYIPLKTALSLGAFYP